MLGLLLFLEGGINMLIRCELTQHGHIHIYRVDVYMVPGTDGRNGLNAPYENVRFGKRATDER